MAIQEGADCEVAPRKDLVRARQENLELRARDEVGVLEEDGGKCVDFVAGDGSEESEGIVMVMEDWSEVSG
jgi:hypothetical protein